VAVLREQTGQHVQRLLMQVQEVLPLVLRVITQTRIRVLEGKKVASERDPCSALFELYTRCAGYLAYLFQK